MNGKITLITPPDLYENSNLSILFVHLSEADQDAVSRWLSTNDIRQDINIYDYQGDINMAWFFHAMNRCEYKYIDVDSVNDITRALSGYILGKSNVYYKVTDPNLSAVYSHINGNRITQIESFLERAFSEQRS